MRRAVVAMLAGAVAACPPPATAQTPVTLQVTHSCDAGEFGFLAQVSGLPPNADFVGGWEGLTTTGELELVSVPLTASASGTFVQAASLPGRQFERITFFVLFEGEQVEQTLIRPCLGPRVPESKDDCTNGGWMTYGVFKNQGDCISFVATGGRNQPSGP